MPIFKEFVQRMKNENVDIKQLGLVGRTKEKRFWKEIKSNVRGHFNIDI